MRTFHIMLRQFWSDFSDLIFINHSLTLCNYYCVLLWQEHYKFEIIFILSIYFFDILPVFYIAKWKRVERKRDWEQWRGCKKLPHNHRKFEINCHVWKIDDGSQIATNQRAETILIRRYHVPSAYTKFVYTCVNTKWQ